MPRLTPHDVERLGRGEELVFDGVLGSAAAQAVERYVAGKLAELTPAAVGRAGERREDPALRGDSTCWLDRTQEAALAPLWELCDHLAREVRERAWLGIGDVEVQIAHYPGGGAHYVRHRDAFAKKPRRRVTAIYYLNQDWSPEDGGELRVFEVTGGAHDVAPLFDRLVVFLSEVVEHEVLPAYAPRWALTLWFLGPNLV